jgi:apolipoprotein N-acyltransferase
MMVQSVPIGPGATLYTRYGDWFGWANIMALGALLLGLIPAIALNSKRAG